MLNFGLLRSTTSFGFGASRNNCPANAGKSAVRTNRCIMGTKPSPLEASDVPNHSVPTLIHNGVTTKHRPLVSRVTSSETASLPPARRVHTEAAAIVQGTLAEISRPTRRSGLACRNKSGKHSNGMQS